MNAIMLETITVSSRVSFPWLLANCQRAITAACIKLQPFLSERLMRRINQFWKTHTHVTNRQSSTFSLDCLEKPYDLIYPSAEKMESKRDTFSHQIGCFTWHQIQIKYQSNRKRRRSKFPWQSQKIFQNVTCHVNRKWIRDRSQICSCEYFQRCRSCINSL